MSDALIGAIVGGLVAAVTSALGFWLTYKTSAYASLRAARLSAAIKKAEFRQAWIENLRRSMAEYTALSSRLVHNQEETILQEDFAKYIEISEYIYLLLNHSEQFAEQIMANMRHLGDICTQDRDTRNKQFYAARSALQESTRKMLKSEWDKLKQELERVEKDQ